jgi:Ca2+-binding RTX toxin-like protein
MHTKTFVLGSAPGQIPVPGMGTLDSATDYQILFVADPTNAVWEADADPSRSNNTTPLTGVYQAATGSVFVHGGRTADQLSISSNGGLTLNGLSYIYTASSVADFRVHLNGGDDSLLTTTTVTKPLVVFAGSGADRLMSGQGNDFLAGGIGDDVYIYDTDTFLGTDTVDDTGGFDWSDFSGTTSLGNTIDLARTTVQTVNANLGLLLRSGSAVDAVLGGVQADTIFGNNLSNILTGGDGNDVIYGRGGNDLSIGGAGADSIWGESGDDLLIAATTSYDNQRTALSSFLAVWTSSDTYESKTASLRRGSSGYPMTARTTVLNDSAVDQLAGGDGTDWFFAATGESPADRLSSEYVDYL